MGRDGKGGTKRQHARSLGEGRRISLDTQLLQIVYANDWGDTMDFHMSFELTNHRYFLRTRQR